MEKEGIFLRLWNSNLTFDQIFAINVFDVDFFLSIYYCLLSLLYINFVYNGWKFKSSGSCIFNKLSLWSKMILLRFDAF